MEVRWQEMTKKGTGTGKVTWLGLRNRPIRFFKEGWTVSIGAGARLQSPKPSGSAPDEADDAKMTL
jgi:hypothetical protein